MTYAVAGPLQAAIYTRLLNDVSIKAAIGGDIYDALPAGALPDTYVSLGPEDVTDASDASGAGAEHAFVISVVTNVSSFQKVKDISTLICDALIDAPLDMARGHLVGLWFTDGRAIRSDNGTTRRVDLTFRARVQDTPIS